MALSLMLVGFLLFAGCAAQPAPESVAEQEIEASRAAAAAEEGERQQQERAGRKPSDPVREKIVVVSPGGQAKATTAGELAEATRADRARFGDRSVGELTDENLAELASQGKVTYAGAEPGAAAPGGEPGGDRGSTATSDAEQVADSAEQPIEPCGETCWRRRAHELRQAWGESAEEIVELEERVADLRWRFYAEDDPWVRDSQIKPEWDRTLDRLRRTRQEATAYGERVDALMEQGRRAGALPGWLRQGVELEPRREASRQGRTGRSDLDPAEPVEPTIADEQSREPKDQR